MIKQTLLTSNKVVISDKFEASCIHINNYKMLAMKASEAYDYVLNEYKLKAKDIALATGKSEADISKFRNGHRNISADLLQLFVQALPPQAKAHFYMLFSYDEEKKSELKVAEKDNKTKV
jgi:hypothetical protein